MTHESKRRTIRNYQTKRLVIMTFTTVTLIFVIFMICFSNCMAGERESKETLHKYYKAVKIMDNDTLTNIANEHFCIGYSSIDDYIDEICIINHIVNADEIYEGQTLVLPYYSNEIL